MKNDTPFDPASFNWNTWVPKEKAVLLFLFRGDKVLLIKKKRGLGAGKINGPGGRLERGETFSEAAIRETYEETGMRASDLVETADLSFVFTDGYSLYAKVFFAYSGEGELRSCDEADPFWHPAEAFPWEEMWADDPLWLPPALNGNYVVGKFIFAGDSMLSQTITSFPRNELV